MKQYKRLFENKQELNNFNSVEEVLRQLKQGEHHLVLCPICDKQLSTCRCMSKEKTIYYVKCQKCNEKV